MKLKLHYLLLSIFIFSINAYSQNELWSTTSFQEGKAGVSLKNLDADNSEILQLNIQSLKQQLFGAPLRSNSNGKSNTIVNFPNVDGKLQQFRIVETSIFSSNDNEHPEIKTYLGSRTDGSGTRIRFSITPLGLKAMISEPGKETVFIQPVTKVSNDQYLIYNRTAQLNSSETFECLTDDVDISKRKGSLSTSRDANDQLLRTFRIAISVTQEYTNFWDDGNAGNGDNRADALAQVVSTLNRMNEVFEVDMAITFVLVDTLDDPAIDLIYSPSVPDPYGTDLNGDLQANLTATVGAADYDIGHLFAFASNNGNAGCIGCVCASGKGSGFSAHEFTDNNGGPYMSDFFDIDYVPHEVGHQMGANHTFSFNSEGTGVNAEPGSGTTIMGYAGITGGNDVQDHSDPYFHYHSIDQILTNVATSPNNCAVTTNITNNPPVANAGSNYTIPNGTAFILKASATDADGGDVLTYCWEQIDDGVTTNGNFGPTKTTGALWRSRPPSTSPNRYMPILDRVLNGQLTEITPVETLDNSSWETVSTVGRDLNFALTVRDRSEAGGVGQTPQSDFDEMLVTVDGASGPFTVTSQTTNVTWDAGSTQTVTWDVAGTAGGAVNTPTVNILLSIDGGLTFPFTMASGVPNDGTQDVTVPLTGGDTSLARVIVEGNNNIFYSVNAANFSIQESEFVITVSNPVIDVCQPADAIYNFTYNTFLGFSDTTNFSVVGLPTGATAVINPTSASADGTSGTVTVSGTGSLAVGSYDFTIEGTSGTLTKSADATLNVFSSTINTVTLISPSNGAIDISADGDLIWNGDVNAEDYFVEVASDAGFSTIVESATVQTTSYTTTSLNANSQYYWRVTASNQCATASPSSAFSFTTANLTCSTFSATDLPVAISASGAGNSYTSVINVADNFPVTDVNVTIDITHTWDADLDITLTSPNGTIVELTSDNGGNGDNYTATIFDQESTGGPITGGVAPFTGSYLPEGDLSLLYGEMSGGDWILTVVDDADADGGNWNSFDLELCVQGSLSVDEFESTISNFKLYPNPNNGSFNIQLANTSTNGIQISVFDMRGRSVYDKRYENNPDFNETINLGAVQSGLYVLQVSDGVNSQTKKIIVN